MSLLVTAPHTLDSMVKILVALWLLVMLVPSLLLDHLVLPQAMAPYGFSPEA